MYDNSGSEQGKSLKNVFGAMVVNHQRTHPNDVSCKQRAKQAKSTMAD
jgi:hypothetical protein